jgi:hypothetical protein
VTLQREERTGMSNRTEDRRLLDDPGDATIM